MPALKRSLAPCATYWMVGQQCSYPARTTWRSVRANQKIGQHILPFVTICGRQILECHGVDDDSLDATSLPLNEDLATRNTC